ncbi:MAG: TIGR00269 family protein [Candidatus Atribacteria bacterium]|nr:TIGR00269 family protein [Candidatus Atribacteria bacterium]
MKCSRCKEPAFVKIKRHNASFCESCFELFFSRQVEGAIKRYQMFGKEEKILLGASGGKDSMALWHYLQHAGYTVQAIHFDLGIGEHSSISRQIVEEFAQAHCFSLLVISVKDLLGGTIPELAKKARHRSTCSFCGLVKRYLLNRFAFEKGFTVYATGHNLDDEAATLLGNVLHWQTGYLTHQSPSLPSPHPKMLRKVKPFYTLTEEEIRIYVKLKNLPFVEDRCPLSHRAKSLDYKEVLQLLEEKSPGTKHAFLFGFLEKAKPLFPAENIVLQECQICGMPTTQTTCSFCKIMQKVRAKEENSCTS